VRVRHTGRMRVLLRTELDCEPDAALRALRSPRVMRRVAAPLLRVDPVGAEAFPDPWTPGPHLARLCALGAIPLGEQTIDIRLLRRGDARLVRDVGRPVSGALALLTRWEHTMAVAPAPGGRTLYRDRLVVSAGMLTPLAWFALWAVWQWRLARMRRLARAWE
jgi:hypothetical protein